MNNPLLRPSITQLRDQQLKMDPYMLGSQDANLNRFYCPIGSGDWIKYTKGYIRNILPSFERRGKSSRLEGEK